MRMEYLPQTISLHCQDPYPNVLIEQLNTEEHFDDLLPLAWMKSLEE